MTDERPNHSPRTCPLAPSQDDFVRGIKEASKAAIRETRREWEPSRVQKWSQLITPALLIAIASTIYYAGANLEALRGELKLAAAERERIAHDLDRTTNGFESYARATTDAIKELAGQVSEIRAAIAEMRGQRDGWRDAREREER